MNAFVLAPAAPHFISKLFMLAARRRFSGS
jgi:hypothetical protein